jgi:hypothetical protein
MNIQESITKEVIDNEISSIISGKRLTREEAIDFIKKCREVDLHHYCLEMYYEYYFDDKAIPVTRAIAEIVFWMSYEVGGYDEMLDQFYSEYDNCEKVNDLFELIAQDMDYGSAEIMIWRYYSIH